MARPLRIEYAGAVYHVTARGNGRQDIYLDDGDRTEFLEILSRAIESYRQFVSDGNNQPSIWEELKNQIYLGSEQFVEDMQCKLNPEQSLENVPKPQKGLVKKPLSYYEKKGASRNEIMALAYRSGCYTLKEIGLYFGVSHAKVGRVVQAYECEM